MWLQMKVQTSGFARIHKVWLQMKAHANIEPPSAAVYMSMDFYKRILRSRVLSIDGPAITVTFSRSARVPWYNHTAICSIKALLINSLYLLSVEFIRATIGNVNKTLKLL